MIGPEFWDMGGYAAFIWPTYGVSLGLLIALGILSFRKMKALEKHLENLKAGKK